MADENHIINIIARFHNRVSKPMHDMFKEIEANSRDSVKSNKDYLNQLNQSIENSRRRIEKGRNELGRFINRSEEENNIVLARQEKRIIALSEAYRLLRNEKRDLDRDSNKLTRTLTRLGRASLGLIIFGVIAFMQGLASAFTAVAGQAVALVGSLHNVAGVLGGTFIAAIAQAIPMLGLLAGAIARLNVVGEALNQFELTQKQSARESTQALDQQREATERVREAQEALTEARKEARREIQDLILAEKEAALGLTETRQNLADAVRTGDVSGVSGLQLDVRGSKLEAQRARQDALKARRGGVSGMPQVIDATRALADAHREAAQAATQQSAAESNLAYFLDQLTPAETRLYKTILRIKDRAEKVFTPITDIIIGSFTRGIEGAEKVLFDPRILSGFRSLSQGMANSFDRVTDAMTNKESRNFWVDTLEQGRKNLKPLTDISLNLWRIFRNISTAAGPALNEILKSIADVTGDLADNSDDISGLEEFFERGVEHLKAWARLAGSLIGLLETLFDVSSESALNTLDDLTGRIDDANEGLKNNKGSAVEFFNETSKAFGYIVDILVRLGEAFVKTFDPDAVRAIRDIFTLFIIPAVENTIIIVGKLAIAFSQFLETHPWAARILELALTFKLVTGAVGLFATTFIFMLGPLKTLFDLLRGIVPLLKEFFKGGKAITGLRFLGWLGLAITALIIFRKQITEAAKALWNELAEPLEELGKAFEDLFETIDDLFGHSGSLEPVMDFFGSIVKDTFRIIGKQLGGFIKILTGFVQIIDGILSGDFGQVWRGIKNIIGGALQSAVATLEMFTAPFRTAGELVGNAFTDAFKIALGAVSAVIIGVIDTALGALSSALDVFADVAEEFPDIPGIPDPSEAADAAKTASDGINILRNTLKDDADQAAETAEQHHKLDNVLKDNYRNTLDLARSSRNNKKETKDHGNAVKETRKEYSSLNAALNNTERNQRQLRRQTKATDDSARDQRRGIRGLIKGLGALVDNLFGTGKQSSELGNVFKKVTNSVLAAFGVKKLQFNIPTAAKVFKGITDIGSALTGGQTGGFMGSPRERGPDDRLIAVAGGEAVLTGHHQPWVNMALAYSNAAGKVPFRNLHDLFRNDKRKHMTAPRGFQRGGMVMPSADPYKEPDNVVSAAIVSAVNQLLRRYKLDITAGYDPDGSHQSPGHNVTGTAIDIVPGPGGSWGLVNQAVRWATSRGMTVYYDGSFGSTNLPPHGPGHHAHIEFPHGGVSAAGMGMIPSKVPRIKVQGPEGMLKDSLQGQSDKLRKAANKYLSKKMAASLGGHGVAGMDKLNVALGPIIQMAKQMVQQLWGAGEWGAFKALEMAEAGWNPYATNPSSGAYGLAQALPPSKYPPAARPGARVPKLEHAKAQLEWMMSYIKDRYGSPSAAWAFHQSNNWYNKGGLVPEFNHGGIVPGPLGMPMLIKAHGGETVLPTHQTGGFAEGSPKYNNLMKIMMGLWKQVKHLFGGGKFPGFEGVVRGQGFAFADMAQNIFGLNPKAANMLLKSRGRSGSGRFAFLHELGHLAGMTGEGGANKLANRASRYLNNKKGFTGIDLDKIVNTGLKVADTVGLSSTKLDRLQKAARKYVKGAGKAKKFQKIWDNLNALTRDGGTLDQITEGIDEFSQQLTVRLKKLSFKIVNGVVSQIATNLNIANIEVDNLEAIYDELHKESRTVNNAIKVTKNKLKKAKKKDSRKKLKTVLNDLNRRRDELEAAMVDQVEQMYQAQRAVYEAAMEEFSQRLTKNELLMQIIQLTGEISGVVNAAGMQSNLQKQGSILQEQYNRIQQEMSQANAVGNIELYRELEIALLETELALLENTKAIKELDGTLNKAFSFNTTSWQLFRQAVLDGMGGLLPQYQALIPSMHTGGVITKSGLFNLKAGEAVVPGGTPQQDIDINITSPTQVADPTQLASSIAWQLKKLKI